MININLLPPTMKAAQRGRDTGKAFAFSNRMIAYGLGGVAGILVLTYGLFVLMPSLVTRIRLAHWQRQWNSIAKSFDEVDSLAKQQRQVTDKLAELAKKKKDKVRWAKILNAISDIMPPSIRLRRITSGQWTEMVPVPLSPAAPQATGPSNGEQAPAPLQTMRRTLQVLELEGIAEKGVLGEEDIRVLLEQIRSSKIFSEYFERIELVGVVTLSNLMKKFSLRCRLKEKKPWQPSSR